MSPGSQHAKLADVCISQQRGRIIFSLGLKFHRDTKSEHSADTVSIPFDVVRQFKGY